MKLYRLVKGKNPVFDLDKESTLPIGKTITGFWQTNPLKTMKLIHAHDDIIYQIYLGNMWEEDADVLITSSDNVILGDVESNRTGNYNSDFDKGEVFCTTIKNESLIERISWLEFTKKFIATL